jgi:uncharacterized protein YecE (DUF72 family)
MTAPGNRLPPAPAQPELFPDAAPERHSPSPGAIRIGTSGYSFDDWIGPFYPPGTRRSQMLAHYQRHFDTVEINMTYYRIPPPATLLRMAERTPPDFRFMVKLPGELTHQRREIAPAVTAFSAAIEPMRDSGKLAGLLAQFPFRFRRGAETEGYLRELRAALPTDPLFAEFRHASWDRDDLAELLADIGYGFCSVDEPALPGLIPRRALRVGETAYVRFHGRNARAWWGGGSERYNYRYAREELEEWAQLVRDLAREAQQTYLFFNNCHAGHAVVNARMMEELLRLA